MAGIGIIFEKIGSVMGAKVSKPKTGVTPGVPAAAVKPGVARAQVPVAGVPGVSGPKKPFDFNMYMKAVNLFFNDFFNKKLPYFFKNIGPVMKKASDWFNKLPGDEKAAYGVLVFGHLFLILGIVFFFV